MAWMSSRDQRWTALYQELLELLERFGKDHPSGEGDFWLVDDDWGGQHHKICIANQKFWSDDVKYSIQNILKKKYNDWGVFVVYDDNSKREGFIVYADDITTEPRWL
jgi:hypothetical protein